MGLAPVENRNGPLAILLDVFDVPVVVESAPRWSTSLVWAGAKIVTSWNWTRRTCWWLSNTLCSSLTAERLSATPDPLALRLDVGLPDCVPLLSYHDLDNYLFPLVPRLTVSTGRRFVSVWATKRHAPTSSIAVCQGQVTSDPGATYSFEVTTTAAADSTAFKEQMRDQITGAHPLPGGGVALQLAFVVGPRRVWPNPWETTIDSLGSLLGRDTGAGSWNARDGRITDLGLHCAVDPHAGNRVVIVIRAGTTTWPT
jgi:hypothetical protein